MTSRGITLSGLAQQARWWFAQSPDQAEPREQSYHPVGEVDLPPAEPVPHGAHAVMVVVVPALAEHEEGNDQVVTAIVGRSESAAAIAVRDGVDQVSDVPGDNSIEEEAEEKTRDSGISKGGDSQRKGRQQPVAVDPDQFGIPCEISHSVEVGVVRAVEDPSDVRVPETP